MKQSFLICLSFAALTGTGHTAESEIPNMLGRWKPITGAYASSGTETQKAPPVSVQQPIHHDVRILEQKGRTFHGVNIRPDGTESHWAGVIAKDGKSFIISVDKGISTGTFEAGKIEICGATSSMEYNLAFCSTLEKVK